MLFCNKSTIEKIREWDERSVHDLDVTQLYTYVCPALLVFCLLSVLFNSVLMAIGHFRQGINRSPILVLSLNLATTDTIASLLTGLGLFLNSYLPVVFNVHISLCQLLVIEIFRVASLVASVLHLLALALVHYRGIVRPLHYRSTLFFSQHLSKSVHIISILCWIAPITVMVIYYSSIPCQGFQSSNCSFLFMLEWKYRATVLTMFSVPLIIMIIIYLRIFIIISRHHHARSASGPTQSNITGPASIGGHYQAQDATFMQLNGAQNNAEQDDIRDKYGTNMACRGLVKTTDNNQRTIAAYLINDDDEATTGTGNTMTDFSILNVTSVQACAPHRVHMPDADSNKSMDSRHTTSSSATADSATIARRSHHYMLPASPHLLRKDRARRILSMSTKSDQINRFEFDSFNPNGQVRTNIVCGELKSIYRSTESQLVLPKLSDLSSKCDQQSDMENSEKSQAAVNFITTDMDSVVPGGTRKPLRQCISYSDTVQQMNGKKRLNSPSNQRRINTIHQSQCSIKSVIKNNHDQKKILTRSKSLMTTATQISAIKTTTTIMATGCDPSLKSSSPEHQVNDEMLKMSQNMPTSTKDTAESDLSSSKQDFCDSTRLYKQILNFLSPLAGNDSSAKLEANKKQYDEKACGKENQQMIDKKIEPTSHQISAPNVTITSITVPKGESDCINSSSRYGETNNNCSINVNIDDEKEMRLDGVTKQTPPTSTKSSSKSINSVSRLKESVSRCQSNSETMRDDDEDIDFSEIACKEANAANYGNLLAAPCTVDPASNASRQTGIGSFYGSANHDSQSLHQRRHVPAGSQPPTNTKALVTTLLILGTYFVCYVPAIAFQILTCIDYCPLPLFDLPMSTRVIVSLITNGLIIVKTIIDPFIYSYRMKEIQMAINRYLSKRRSRMSTLVSLSSSQRQQQFNSSVKGSRGANGTKTGRSTHLTSQQDSIRSVKRDSSHQSIRGGKPGLLHITESIDYETNPQI